MKNQGKKFSRREVLECLNKDFVPCDSKNGEYMMIEQWKGYTASAEQISNKRQNFIIWINGMNSLLIGGIIAVLQLGQNEPGEKYTLYIILPIIGIGLAVIAWIRIIMYRERKRIKYAQIYAIEKHMPFKVYTNEYHLVKRRKQKNKLLFSGTQIELLFPFIFMIIYISLLIWGGLSHF